DLVRWIDGHHAFCRQVFAGAEDFLDLPMDAPDARDRLAGFLGIDLPWWGVANANTRHPAAAE
ncbi:MAG: sulfotransferase family protein, partial [Rhodobacteraceae bacterium]|nr:sulfotransferase family protein [Paracoccaceae bacterium]